MNTLNVNRFNERKAYEVHIRDKEHELDVAIKNADMESTKGLGNNIVIK